MLIFVAETKLEHSAVLNQEIFPPENTDWPIDVCVPLGYLLYKLILIITVLLSYI